MIDYTSVTEVAGEPVTRDAVAMMHGRYRFVADRSVEKDVLELSCGVGQGLGLTARVARSVIGLDITMATLLRARSHYQHRVPLVGADAAALPFVDASFDLVAIHEAIYYYPDLRQVISEVQRVLRPDGQLCISTVNPEWADFNPSPFSTAYFSAAALSSTLQSTFAEVELFGASPVVMSGATVRVLSVVKRVAVALRLIPRTMKGKRLLKRIAYGPLVQVPAELEDVSDIEAPVKLPESVSAVADFKVIYAVASRPFRN